MKGYADLANVPENQRIRIIGQCVAVNKQTVAVALDNDEKKIARYRRKLMDARPGLLEIDQLPGLVPNTVMLCVKPKSQNTADN